MVAVPFKMLLRRPVGGIGGQGDFSVFHAGEQASGFAGLGEVSVGDENGVVIAKGPQPVVEQPVGVFGEGEAVVQGVVAALGELVDVGGAAWCPWATKRDGSGGNVPEEALSQVEELLGSDDLLQRLLVVYRVAGSVIAAVAQLLSFHEVTMKFGRHPAASGKFAAEG
jgi:hypothetical protein